MEAIEAGRITALVVVEADPLSDFPDRPRHGMPAFRELLARLLPGGDAVGVAQMFPGKLVCLNLDGTPAGEIQIGDWHDAQLLTQLAQ